MKAHRGTFNYWLTQKSTAACLVPILLITNLSSHSDFVQSPGELFRYIHAGMEEILADHVNHEVTFNWILILPRILLLVIIKDFGLFFVLH